MVIMKKIHVLALAILIFISCSSDKGRRLYLNDSITLFYESEFRVISEDSISNLSLYNDKGFEISYDRVDNLFDLEEFGLTVVKFNNQQSLSYHDEKFPSSYKIGEINSSDFYALLMNKIVVKFDTSIDTQRQTKILESIIGESNLGEGVIEREEYNENFVTIQISSGDVIEIAQKLNSQIEIEFAHPDLILKKRLYSNEFDDCKPPEYKLDDHWHHEIIGSYDGWCHTTGNDSVIIAIIDDAFDIDHFELRNNVILDDHRRRSQLPGPTSDEQLNQTHGTLVAGVAVASEGGGRPLGVCPNCKFHPVKASGSVNDLASYIRNDLIFNVNASIISISWDYDVQVYDLSSAFEVATIRGRDSLGIPICLAIGNFGNNACRENINLAALDNVISVGGSTTDDKVLSLNKGKCLDIIAPANNILSCRYDTESVNRGTIENMVGYINNSSAATPIVAGAIGLMLSYDPSLTYSQIETILKETSVRIYNEHGERPIIEYCDGQSEIAGYGRLDITNIFEKLTTR